MENQERRFIEVNGVKIEVDMRTARLVTEFKVGSPVKILIKNYSDYKSHFGMIVGFDEFKSLPTMIVAYVSSDSWEKPLQFAYINAKTENTEICAADPSDMGLNKADVLGAFDREENKKRQELDEIQRKRKYFTEQFGRYFEPEVAKQA